MTIGNDSGNIIFRVSSHPSWSVDSARAMSDFFKYRCGMTLESRGSMVDPIIYSTTESQEEKAEILHAFLLDLFTQRATAYEVVDRDGRN
jgi:hypothetical protein